MAPAPFIHSRGICAGHQPRHILIAMMKMDKVPILMELPVGETDKLTSKQSQILVISTSVLFF